ncbi:hypothetical protein VAE122_3040098 [Vibrio aestuarianus]|nr:hypothetical protein VAE122_3040098 [Vibrio aestuarianus]
MNVVSSSIPLSWSFYLNIWMILSKYVIFIPIPRRIIYQSRFIVKISFNVKRVTGVEVMRIRSYLRSILLTQSFQVMLQILRLRLIKGSVYD